MVEELAPFDECLSRREQCSCSRQLSYSSRRRGRGVVRGVVSISQCSCIASTSSYFLCAFSRVKLVYLPPYSPDLNPIEECFSYVKAYIRRRGHEFRDIVEQGDVAAPYLFLYEALETVTPAASYGWFSHSGYV